jgi:hypothetical protein
MNSEPGVTPTPGHQFSLLDTVIILLIACSIVIFVFTIGAKFLGRDTFDKLPDFLKDSYSALWSAGVVAGGALVGSVIDALSKRESTRASFITYVFVTTLLLMVLIVGTVGLSRAVEGPQFAVPNGATGLKLTPNTSGPVSFYLQNRLIGGNQARIRGSYQLKDGELTGEVVDSELEPATGAAVQAIELTSISIHVCYLAVRNGLPVSTQRPEFPTGSNREAISVPMNMQQAYQIPTFKFRIDVRRIDNIAPSYLCAFVDGQQNMHMIFF